MVHAPEAEQAWNLAKSRPAEAIDLTRSLLRRLPTDDPDRAVALAARGRARYELGDNDQAIADLRRAADEASGSVRNRSLIALSAAMAAGGDNRAAAELLESVIAAETGDEADPTIWATAVSQLGFLRMIDGDMTGAVELLERATGPLREDPDEHDALARVLGNAGHCQLVIGNLERAIDLFDQAVHLGQLTDQQMLVVGCLQNKGCVLSLLGDFPEALAQFHRARELYDELGGADRNQSTLYDDMADTYRLAGLTRDAVAHAEAALRSVEGRGNVEKEADARYRLAVCLLDEGEHRRAIDAAERAGSMFEAAGRSLWQTRATLVAVEAATADRLAPNDEQVEEVAAATDRLERAGWRTEALRLRNRMLLIGLGAGDRALVDRFLLDGAAEHDQSVVGRLEGLLHRAVGDTIRGGRADRPLDEARATLGAHRSRLGDPELRAGSGRLAQAFRFIALTQEMGDGDPSRILETEERWRAASLRLPRARPSSDPVVAELTRQLRDATRQAADGAAPDPELDIRIRRLEDRLRWASHQVRGEIEPGPTRPDPIDGGHPDELVERLTDRLDGRRLVEWFGHRNRLYAIDVEDGRAELREVGRLSDIRSSANRLRRDLARQLHAPVVGGDGRRWRRIEERSADLGRLLLGRRAGAAGLVLSPPGALQELPWSLLTPERGTPLAIVFSASSWLQATTGIDEPAIHVVAGPDLAHGLDDHRAALAHFGPTTVAGGDRAAMERAIGRADLLHVAAHGRFRADNPMFSSVRLADGDFALHELADFDRVPPVVALAACDAGRSHHLEQGAEQLGTASAWLGAGVETIVAPICAVPDESTAIVFGHFYRALPGSNPGDALGRLCAELADAEPDLRATAAAFLCFGTGGPTLGPAADRPT